MEEVTKRLFHQQENTMFVQGSVLLKIFPVVWIFLRSLGIILKQWILAILSKECKPDSFVSRNSLICSFKNIWGLHSNFVDCESLLESHSPDIFALCETNLDGSIDSGNFLCEVLYFFNPKGFYYLYTWSCSLCEGRTSFCSWVISRKLCGFVRIFSTDFTSLNVLPFFLYQSPSLSLCTVFYSLSSDIDEVLSISPSANRSVFGDFNSIIRTG